MSEHQPNFCVNCTHYAEGVFTRLCLKDKLAPDPVNGAIRGVPCRDVRYKENDDLYYCQFFIKAPPWYVSLWNWLTGRAK